MIGLARRGGADIPPLIVVVTEMGHGVGPGRHRLCLECFELGKLVGAHFNRYDPAEILLHGKLIDKQQLTTHASDPKPTSITTAADRGRPVAGRGEHNLRRALERTRGAGNDHGSGTGDPVSLVKTGCGELDAGVGGFAARPAHSNPDKAATRRLLPHPGAVAEPPSETSGRRCGGFGTRPGTHLPSDLA